MAANYLEELEKVFNKELFLIKNDLYYQQMALDREGQTMTLRVDISYQPYDVLSGDTYSLRKTHDGRLVGFIADAMGKGVAAAMSAMAVTRFLNYFYEDMEEEEGFVFETWVAKMVRFLQRNLHNDELMCIALIEFDTWHSIMRYALCGMPAMIIEAVDGTVLTLPSNNPPIFQFTQHVDIKTTLSGRMKRVLCYTDGLSESFMEDGKPYAQHLKEDFVRASCARDFRDTVRKRIGKGEDDLTYVFVEKIMLPPVAACLFIPSTYEGVDEALQAISAYLKEQGINAKTSSELILTFSELLLNALEHGSFGINQAQKHRLIEEDLFDTQMEKWEFLYQHKLIRVSYGMVQTNGRHLFEATIEDEGEGFDTAMLKALVIDPESVNGRGFVIIKKLLDHFYFNEKGNAITIQKFLEL